VGDRAADGTDRVRADCVWPVAPERVIEAVSDVGSHDDWLSSVTESTVRADGRVVQVHRASGIADRQITLDVTRETLPGGGFRTAWTRASQQVPLVKGRVDCARDDGSWEVHPATGGGARVVYSLRYDPGGSVPAWVVRAFQKGGIADLVEEMRKVVERTHSRARP